MKNLFDRSKWQKMDGYEIYDSTDGMALTVTGPWNPEIQDLVSSGSVKILILNCVHGFCEADLDFVQQWPIRRVFIIARWIDDLSPLERLAESLVELSIECAAKCSLNLELFPQLHTLSTPWKYVSKSIPDARQLRDLFFLGYGAKDLTPLSKLSNLEKIAMKHYPSLQSLDGVEKLDSIKEFELYMARKFSDISALINNQSLTHLTIDRCRKVDDWRPIFSLPNLTHLNISNNGDIASLSGIENLRNLEYLSMIGSTKILDGDLSHLKKLKHLKDFSSQDRRMYSPSPAEIVEGISSSS